MIANILVTPLIQRCEKFWVFSNASSFSGENSAGALPA
jgi:hypothetical protein